MVHRLSRAPAQIERLPRCTVKEFSCLAFNFDPGCCFNATPDEGAIPAGSIQYRGLRVSVGGLFLAKQSVDLLRHALNDEGAEFRYLLTDR